MPAVIALVIVIAGLAVCILPLLEAERPRVEMDPLEERDAERERLVAAIRDIDLDLAMGKISADDHRAMRASLEGQALTVLASMDASRDEERSGERPA